MLDCIRRVPARCEWIIANRDSVFAPLVRHFGDRLKRVDELVLIGSGTSNTSAVTARFIVQQAAGIRITPVLPSEFLHDQAVRNPHALYVAISQTGTSLLTRQALAQARQLGYMTASITESDQTPIASEADAFINMGCGMEEYPMRTIGYSTTILTLVLLGMVMGEQNGTLSSENRDKLLLQAVQASAQIPSMIDQTLRWLEVERRQMLRADCLVFTGSGALAGVAIEASVKMWETPQIVTLAYELEEGLHAPNYGYTQRHCVLVLNDGGVDNDKARALCNFMKNEKQNGFLIGLNPVDMHDLGFSPSGGALSCLVFAAIVQTMAYQLALVQGRDLVSPHDNRVMYSYFDTHRINEGKDDVKQ